METTENTQTETASTAITNPIELSVVRGETSGLFQIDTNTGDVTFSKDITHDQWREALHFVITVHHKLEVVVANFIAYGIKEWGQVQVDTDLEQLEFEMPLVKAALAINSIPKSLRHDNLTGDHYVELAKSGLPKKEMSKWAKIASDQHLTPSQLRYSIAEGEVVDRAAAKQLNTGVITIQGIRQEFDVWLRKVGGLNGVKAMDLDHQNEILEEVSAICEFGMLLNEYIVSITEPNVKIVEVPAGAA